MNLAQLFKNVLVHATVQHTHLIVPPDHVDPIIQEAALEPERAYFQLRLNEMFLAHDLKLYKTRYPVLHAFVHFLAEGEDREAIFIAGPRQLQGFLQDSSRLIARNYQILGPVPYRGGDIEILFQLLAVTGDDLAANFLNLLGTVANVAGLGQVAVALNIADALKDSLETLFRLRPTELCIGLYDRLIPKTAGQDSDQLIPGYHVVSTVPQKDLQANHVWIREGQLLVGPNINQAHPLQDADYFLFQLQRVDRRHDWSTLPTIGPRVKAFMNKLASSTSENDTRTEFELFKGAVLASPDLIYSDRVSIIRGIKQRAQEAMELRRVGLDDGMFLSDPDSGEPLSLLGNLRTIGHDLPLAETQSVAMADLVNTHL